MLAEIPVRSIDHGRNVKFLRKILGYTQEKLAFDLEMSQQALSDLEKKETIDDKTIKKIALAMKVPVEAIKNMTEDSTYNFINTFNENIFNDNSGLHNTINNPIEKIVELYNEKIELYEKLLQSEREKNELLKKLLSGKE